MSTVKKPTEAVPTVSRRPDGRWLPGSVPNPKGVNRLSEVDRTLNSEIAKLCREILNGKGENGKNLFETRVRQILDPIWEMPLRKGERRPRGAQWRIGLRNPDVILRCLEFLVRRGYGAEPGPIDDETQKNLGGMIVVVHAPRPQRAGLPQTTSRTIELKPS